MKLLFAFLLLLISQGVQATTYNVLRATNIKVDGTTTPTYNCGTYTADHVFDCVASIVKTLKHPTIISNITVTYNRPSGRINVNYYDPTPNASYRNMAFTTIFFVSSGALGYPTGFYPYAPPPSFNDNIFGDSYSTPTVTNVKPRRIFNRPSSIWLP